MHEYTKHQLINAAQIIVVFVVVMFILIMFVGFEMWWLKDVVFIRE